jgi:hypothetical protein
MKIPGRVFGEREDEYPDWALSLLWYLGSDGRGDGGGVADRRMKIAADGELQDITYCVQVSRVSEAVSIFDQSTGYPSSS